MTQGSVAASEATAPVRAPVVRGVRILLGTFFVLVLVDLVLRLMTPHLIEWETRSFEPKQSGFLNREEAGIVLLGSSRAAFGLSPPQFEEALGRPVFNLAIPAFETAEWLALCRDLLEDRRPELVVLGINAGELHGGYEPREAATFLYRFPEVLQYTMSEGFNRRVWSRYLDAAFGRTWVLYGRRYSLKLMISEQLGHIHERFATEAKLVRLRNSRRQAADGFDHPWFTENHSAALPARRAAGLIDGRLDAPAFQADGYAFKNLSKVLRWFADREIPIVVVYLPNSPWTQQHWQDVEATMIDRIAQVCRSEDVAFVSSVCEVSDDDFFDENHLSLEAARRFSASAAAKIARLGLLPTDFIASVGEPE